MTHKSITVREKKNISVGDIISSIEGRARLELVGSSFTSWSLIDKTDQYPFGHPRIIEDNCLNNFVLY